MNGTLFLVMIAAVIVQVLGLHGYNIASQSMMPTMAVGDYVVAQRYSATDAPQRGDLIVFHDPRGSEVDWVKRVIGLPGDRVRLRSGQVYLNGAALPLERVSVDTQGDVICVERTPEGRDYHILKRSLELMEDTPEVVVPPRHYYVLGDSRDNSIDSREPSIGTVPREKVAGRLYVVFWSRSLDRLGTWLE